MESIDVKNRGRGKTRLCSSQVFFHKFLLGEYKMERWNDQFRGFANFGG